MKKKKEKINLGNFFEEQYKISFSYIKESKNFIYFAILVFFAFVILGFLIQLPPNLNSQILDYFHRLVEETQGFGWIDLITFIFSNNLLSGFMGLFFGVILGIFPFFSSAANGFMVGFAASLSVSKEGIFSLWRLFPHGIFELPAIFISFGLGLKLSTFLGYKEKWKTLRKFIEKSVSVYIFVIIPLLVVAAIIEGTLIFFGV